MTAEPRSTPSTAGNSNEDQGGQDGVCPRWVLGLPGNRLAPDSQKEDNSIIVIAGLALVRRPCGPHGTQNPRLHGLLFKSPDL
jgi:hypothetical protein